MSNLAGVAVSAADPQPHPFVAFCEKAMVSPDTSMSPRELAVRYSRFTGETLREDEVERLAEQWKAYAKRMQGVTVKVAAIDPTWFGAHGE